MSVLVLVIVAFVLSQLSLNEGSAGWLSLQPAPSPQISSNSFSFPSFDNTSCSSDSQLICSGSVTAKHGYLSLTNTKKKNNKKKKVRYGEVLYLYPMEKFPSYFITTFTLKVKKAANSSVCSGNRVILLMSSPHDNDDKEFLEPKRNSTDPPVIHRSIGKSYRRKPVVVLDTYENSIEIKGQPVVKKDTYNNTVAVVTVEYPIGGKSSLDTYGIKLTSGRRIKFRVEYNSITNWVRVFAAYSSKQLVTVSSARIDLEMMHSKVVFVGFMATAMEFGTRHELLSWDFKATQ